MKITVIGAGNMGGALAKGWFRTVSQTENKTNGLILSAADICVTARSQETLDRMKQQAPGIGVSNNNVEAVKGADLIVLAVKPWLVETVAHEIAPVIDAQKQIVCSVAAGVGTDKLTEYLCNPQTSKAPVCFYVMPNIAAEFGASMTFIAPSKGATHDQTECVRKVFALVGDTSVCEEKMIGPGMMMAGCGIAYVMRFIRAQMEAGVEMGFYPKDALQIALQTMDGAVQLLRQTGAHPEAAIDKVTTPGGTTIKGLNELDHAGFNSAVIRCLKAGLK